ncbi:MAG: hypothetical protein RJB13_2311 [Pseudomonadota bacterium]|jgi:hypothetical protein
MFYKNSSLLPKSTAQVLFTLAVTGLLPLAALAKKKHYGAHQHGVAQVNIVADGRSVTIQLETPADSIYGFEHEAIKPADIEKRDSAILRLKEKSHEIFVLDSALNCKLNSSEIKPFVTNKDDASTQANTKKTSMKSEHQKKHAHHHHHKKGTHAEVHATFQFECEKPVSGSTLSFSATSHFKALRTLKVQVLSGEKQSGLTVKNDKGSVSL